MRELEKMREKKAFHFEGRHVFVLFVASIGVIGGAFVGGVWVGKRIAQPSAADLEGDPLAVIDQLGNDGEIMAFEKGLGRPAAPPPMPAAIPPQVFELDSALTTPRPPQPPSSGLPSAPTQKPDPEPTLPSAPLAPAAAAPAAPAASPPETAPSTTARRSATGFTLQVSSFQNRKEAEEYTAALVGKGYEAYVVSSEVPDKGLWYRVRLGQFSTYDAALVAKADFERKHNVIAYVSKVSPR